MIQKQVDQPIGQCNKRLFIAYLEKNFMGKRDKDCWKPEKHPRHMCKLYKQGMMMEYDQQSQSPTVSCAKCGAKADLAEAVCQPKPL